MAHNRDVPIRFCFQSQRRLWEVFSFAQADQPTLAGSDKGPFALAIPPMPALSAPALGTLLTQSYGPIFRLYRRGDFASLFRNRDTYSFYSDDMNACIEDSFDLRSQGKELPEAVSELLVSFPRDDAPPRDVDPWKMRDDFLRLPETNAALLDFLNRWGLWDRSQLSVGRSLKMIGRGLDDPAPLAVIPFLVWKRRREFRTAILGKADTWLANNASLGMTERRTRYPFLGITDTTCAKAIETTITLDHLRNTKSRICARPDCDNIFAVESAHGKVYCEQYCAHLVSVRKTRAARKIVKSKKQFIRKSKGV